MALSPAIVFVAMTAVIRGYLVGMKNMTKHSMAQIIEQVINSVFSIIFVIMLLGRTPEILAAGSTMATTVATFVAFIYLLTYYLKNKKDILEEISLSEKFDVATTKQIVKKLISYVIPISFGSVVITLSSLIDAVTVVDALQKFGYTLSEANIRYGALVGKVDVLNMLPLSINVAFGVALVPFISTAFAKKDYADAKNKINFSVKLSAMLAFPAAIGLSLMAKPIFETLYPNATFGYELLQIQAFMVIFAVIAQTLYGSLQGMGKLYIPGMCLLIGVVTKYLLNTNLIPIFGEKIAPMASVTYHFIACSLAFILTYSYLKEKPNFSKLFGKTRLSTIFMAVMIIICLNVFTFLPVYLLTLVTICLAILTYILCIFSFKTFTNEEILMMPKGDKINKILQKLGLN